MLYTFPRLIINENQAFPGNCDWTVALLPNNFISLTQIQSTFVLNNFLLLFSGADIIITYYVPSLLDWLKEN